MKTYPSQVENPFQVNHFNEFCFLSDCLITVINIVHIIIIVIVTSQNDDDDDDDKDDVKWVKMYIYN